MRKWRNKIVKIYANYDQITKHYLIPDFFYLNMTNYFKINVWQVSEEVKMHRSDFNIFKGITIAQCQ